MLRFIVFMFISSLSVHFLYADALKTPKGVKISVDDRTFSVNWDEVSGENITYKLKIWQEEVGTPGGIVDFEEKFDDVFNKGTTAKNITSDLSKFGLDDWSGSNVYAKAMTANSIQVGNSTKTGLLITPPLSNATNSNYTLEIRARTHEMNKSFDILRIRGIETNVIKSLDITPEFQTYTISLEDLSKDDQLGFSSLTVGDRRISLDFVALIADYTTPRIISTNIIDEISGISANEHELNGDDCELGTYYFSVCTVAGDGSVSEWSDPVSILLTDSEDDDTVTDDGEENSDPTLTIEGITAGAFSLSWGDFVNSNNKEYFINIWTNKTEGFISGTSHWYEYFELAPATNSSITITDKNFASYINPDSDGWSYSKLYLSKTAGTIRLGNTSTNGWIKTPSLGIEKENVTLRIYAWQYSSKDGDKIPIEIISDNTTNLLEILTINDKPSYYNINIPTTKPDDALLIHSPTNKTNRRIVIDSIEILEGFDPGVTTPVTITKTNVGNSRFSIIRNLPPVECYVQVEGHDKQNSDSTVTKFSQIITVDLANPPTNSYWKTSGFKQNAQHEDTRHEDFGYVTNITKAVEWLNGISIQGFYARKDEKLANKIMRDTRKSKTGGLYSSYTNKNNYCWSLSLLSTGSADTSVELQTLNDTTKTSQEVKFEFDTYQWTFSGKTNAVLSYSYAITKDVLIPPKSSDWIKIETNSPCVTQQTIIEKTDPAQIDEYGYSKERNVVILPINLEPNEMLYFRWTHNKVSNAPMLGIGNLTVSIVWKKKSFVFIVR